MPENEPRRLAVIENYHDLTHALRQRANELAISRASIDQYAGLPLGYAGKLLGPVPVKAIGRTSLGPLLSALGVKLVLIEDLALVQRISERLEKRNDAAVRHRPKLDQRKRPKGPEWAKLMNARRMLVQPLAERKRLARHAARFRWRKGGAQDVTARADANQGSSRSTGPPEDRRTPMGPQQSGIHGANP